MESKRLITSKHVCHSNKNNPWYHDIARTQRGKANFSEAILGVLAARTKTFCFAGECCSIVGKTVLHNILMGCWIAWLKVNDSTVARWLCVVAMVFCVVARVFCVAAAMAFSVDARWLIRCMRNKMYLLGTKQTYTFQTTWFNYHTFTFCFKASRDTGY